MVFVLTPLTTVLLIGVLQERKYTVFDKGSAARVGQHNLAPRLLADAACGPAAPQRILGGTQ